MCPGFMDEFIFWLITFWVSRVSQCPESLDTKKPGTMPGSLWRFNAGNHAPF